MPSRSHEKRTPCLKNVFPLLTVWHRMQGPVLSSLVLWLQHQGRSDHADTEGPNGLTGPLASARAASMA
jgi:hypothetical protein